MFLLLAFACTAPETTKPADTDHHADTSPDSAPDSADSADSARDTSDTADGAPPRVTIVFMADDLGTNVMWAMPIVEERLAPEAVRFSRAYVTVPLCCPVRSSFLSGGYYPEATGVLGNDLPNGGIARFRDADTLATRLQAQGVATALLGKYLNGYEGDVAPYIPPGWDLFLAPSMLGDFTNSVFVRGSSTPSEAGVGVFEDTGGEHMTGWLVEEALAFLDAHPDGPVFVFLVPQSPHIYGTPMPEDRGAFASYEHRPPSFDEADMSDKPAWLRNGSTPTAVDIDRWDAETELMLDNGASLDRAFGALLDGLTARGLDEDTTLLFTSDNGHLHGEHRLVAKGVAYEESVGVPLMVRAPGLVARDDARLVAINLDIPATVAELGGITPYAEGLPLSDALADPTLPIRDHVFLDTAFGAHPVWAAVVTDRWKYVEWGTGETELYDLAADPYEMESLHAAPPADADLATLAAWVDEHRALNITTSQLPTGSMGLDYAGGVAAWGGEPPLSFALASGALPGGLTLATDGTIAGVPTEAGTFTVEVRVTDAGISPATGEPRTFSRAYQLSIGTAARASATREGADAVFVIPARPGQHVEVRLTLEDTHDTPPLRAPVVIAGADGLARVRMAGVPDAYRRWHARVDEVTIPGGWLETGR